MEIKEIKRRLRSIREIHHITRAMQTVATFRLKRAEERILSARPFAKKISEVLVDSAAISKGQLHPLMERRIPRRVCFMVFTSDRGLCGAFNVNIIKKALYHINSLQPWQKVRIVTIGRKGLNYFKRLPYRIAGSFEGISSKPSFEDAVRIANFIRDKFLHLEFDEVMMIYSRFYTALLQKPREFRLLPIVPVEEAKSWEDIQSPFIYEPSPRDILNHLVERYLEAEIFRALLETDAGENGARMASMSASVKNAQAIEKKLTHHYHQARQSIITRELSEIVGGARAIEKNRGGSNV